MSMHRQAATVCSAHFTQRRRAKNRTVNAHTGLGLTRVPTDTVRSKPAITRPEQRSKFIDDSRRCPAASLPNQPHIPGG
jgi:hypothetical protein